MRWRKLVSLGCLGWLGACSSSSTENGQTGSSGYGCDNDSCAKMAQDLLDWVGQRYLPTFVASHCREPNLGPADSESLVVQSCQCIEADGTITVIEATGASTLCVGCPWGSGGSGSSAAATDSVVSTEACLAWGRGHLACALPPSEATRCTTSDPHSCDPICARLQQGYEQDAERSYDVELRSSQCRAPSLGCANVARINDSCYVTTNTGFFGPEQYDCSLTDAQILDQRDGAIPGRTSAGGGGG